MTLTNQVVAFGEAEKTPYNPCENETLRTLTLISEQLAQWYENSNPVSRCTKLPFPPRITPLALDTFDGQFHQLVIKLTEWIQDQHCWNE